MLEIWEIVRHCSQLRTYPSVYNITGESVNKAHGVQRTRTFWSYITDLTINRALLREIRVMGKVEPRAPCV